MAGSFFKWLIPGLLTIGGGTVLALMLTGATMDADLNNRASGALRAGGFSWAAISLDGRDVLLTGTADSPRTVETALTRLAALHGVASVTSDVTLAQSISPFPFVADLENGAITLSGGYPNEATHAALLAAAPGATDELRLLSGGPDRASFLSATTFGLSALGQLDQGEVHVADLSVSVTGRARSLDAFDNLATLNGSVPAGITLAALKITPPLANPFVFKASFDGKLVTVTGNAPTAGFADTLRAASPSIPVSTSLVLASGEMPGFSDKALTLLKTLLLLESGQVSMSGAAISLSGAPPSAEIADQVTAAVAALGGTASLDPPRIATFSFTASKAGGKTVLTGYVPDAATLQRFQATPELDASGLKLGRGAPDRFASALDYGLSALAHLDDGNFSITGERLSLAGRASTLADLKALDATLAEGPPQGFSLAAADLHPPVANPFTWSATKAADGQTTIAGFVPSESARSALHAAIDRLAADNANPADGAPDNFQASALEGLAVLALLDTGSVSFDGSHWGVTGEVDSAKKGFAVDSAFSVAGLRTAGWSYDVRLPTLAVIDPYVWRAQKTADGHFIFTGFVPDADFKSFMLTRGGAAATDATGLGAGAPDNFSGSATAGLEALAALDEGSLGVAGAAWTLTGQTANSQSRDDIQKVLSGRIDPSQWVITIQALDAAPVVTPYLWAADKQADGSIDLSGYLPSESLKQFSEARAGQVGRNSVVLASGEPAGFAEDVLAGLDALGHLSTGRAAFNGSQWTLSGIAATPQEGTAALSALTAGSNQGAGWERAVEGLPPATSAAELASSESMASEAPATPDIVSVQPPDASEASTLSSEASDIAVQSSEAAPSAQSSAEASAPPAAGPSPVLPAPPSEPPAPTIPQTLIFEVARNKGEALTLKGAVPAEAARLYFGTVAGDVPTDGLTIGGALPPDFIGNALAAIGAVGDLAEGRAGFDGSKWWLAGKAESEAIKNRILANIAALPGRDGWSSDIAILPAIDICRDKVAAVASRNAIVFKSGSSTLADSSLPVLDEVAADLAICPVADVHVEGHTDADGAEDINLALSVSRAETVVTALIDRGVGMERLYAEGFGESDPIASNDTKEGKAQNRRIGFTITEPAN